MEQYHFEFNNWKEAFEMFYRKRCGYDIETNGKKYKREGNPNIVFIVSKSAQSIGYWVEEKGQNAKSDAETKVYRSVKAVKQLEKDVRASLSGRRVTPRPSFQPPETCPDCIASVPFDDNGKHVRSA